jgi:hypothetical protein
MIGGALPSASSVNPVVKPQLKLLALPAARVAMNGAIVTYAVSARGKNACARVFIWNVATDASAVVSGRETCEADNTSTGGGIVGVASAGKRSAWIVNGGSNTEFGDVLYTSSLPSPKAARVASAGGSAAGGDPWSGDFIEDMQGQGEVLLVRSGSLANGRPVREALQVVTPTGLSPPFAGTAPIDDDSLDGGRIAVLRGTNVALYSASRGRIGSIALGNAQPVLRVILTGDRLVVRHADDLAVYDVRSGRRLRSFATTGSPRSLDVDGRVGVFSRLDQIYVVSLATGKTKLLATVRVSEVGEPQLAIGPAGVVYAVRNRIVYYPRSLVEATLRR